MLSFVNLLVNVLVNVLFNLLSWIIIQHKKMQYDTVNRALVTIREMMTDRGHLAWAKEMEKMDMQEVKKMSIQKLIYYFDFDSRCEENEVNDEAGQLRLLFGMQPKFKLSDVKKYIDEDYDLTIIILREKISTTNMKSIDEMKKTGGDIQVFQIKELQYNITKHVLVPKHELLGWDKEEEIEEIVSKFQLKNRTQLPSILKTDPMARYLNAKPGNLIRITRPSPTAGEYTFYRCCI